MESNTVVIVDFFALAATWIIVFETTNTTIDHNTIQNILQVSVAIVVVVVVLSTF